MLTFLQVRDSGGAIRVQRLDRLSPERQSELVHGPVERVHQVGPDGAVVEDVLTGKVKRHGHQGHGPGPLAELRARIPKPKPKPTKGAKPGA
jgi:acetyl-CoA acetyltransferase